MGRRPAIAAYALLNFCVFWGYYIVFELAWGGRTPGKRVAKIRIVRADGGPAGASEIVVRNLVRMIDMLPVGYLIGLITMLANRQARRLGDFAAGTLVVKAGGEVMLDSLLVAPRTESLPPTPVEPDLDVRRLTPAEYGLVRDLLLRDSQQALQDELVARLAGMIAAKLGYGKPAANASREFLAGVAEAYRRHT